MTCGDDGCRLQAYERVGFQDVARVCFKITAATGDKRVAAPAPAWPYRRFPRILDALTIVRPETIVRWHRNGFGALWRWKSRPLGGRPRTRSSEIEACPGSGGRRD